MKTLFLFFLVALAAAFAEERPLSPVNRSAFSGEVRCLPYFVSTTYGGATAELVIFAYRTADGGSKGSSVLKSEVVTYVTERQMVPTYEEVVSANDGRTNVIFRLSPTDYEHAKACLTEAQKQ